MTDEEIDAHLHWIYQERILCRWCEHPTHMPFRHHLCSSCYRLALDFRKRPTLAVAVAISNATNERAYGLVNRRIRGLDVELLFERLARAAFPWRKPTDNPFWHTANTWSHCFSPAQRRLLYHHFSLVEREQVRRARRFHASGVAFELQISEREAEIKRYLSDADRALSQAFSD